MDTREVIRSQYLSALAMLKQAIVKCPRAVWDALQDKDKFWFRAYHTLYYAHLYLQPTRKDFVRWKNHRKPNSGVPISKKETLEYLVFVEQQVAERIPFTDLEAKSGFHELPFDKLELQFYNIRHIQQHTGELYERLGARKNIKLAWAGHVHRKKK